MVSPLISIIMNCYNGEKFLERSLKSIISQEYKNWELIFWDNLSTDSSKEIFKKFNDKRFKYYCAKKHTILYRARNLALKKCKGKYISFLDTDDYWLKDKLKTQIKIIEQNSSIGMVYGNCLIKNDENLFKKKSKYNPKKFRSGNITRDLLNYYNIGILTILIRKSFMKGSLREFNIKYDMLADKDYILRFSTKYQIFCTKKIVAVYNKHENQLQNLKINKQAVQFNSWLQDLRKNRVFNKYDLKELESKNEFLKHIKFINQNNFFNSLFKILKFNNNMNKIKLLVLLFLPKFISKKIFIPT